MPTDKKISELPITTAINASDISVLVDNGADYQYTFTVLLQFLEANLATGAGISFGTVLPQNTAGKNGDVFVNTYAGSFAQKIAGIWTVVYTLPAANGADGTLLYGAGMPGTSVGKNTDSYINTLTGTFYQKTAGVWSQVFSMAIGPQGPRGAAGTNGTNGTDGNAILFGTTDPSNTTTGADGNFYINTTTYILFGPKASGVWGPGVSLIGAGMSGGGAAGQILAKADSTDFNTIWEDMSFANLSGQPNDNTNMAAALNGKEDVVHKDAINGYAGLDGRGDFNKTTDNLPEGGSNFYFTAARVLDTILAGVDFLTAAAVLASDTILEAIGKLQAQITALLKIPGGGTAGQVLTKIDATDGNTQWSNVLAAANNLSDLGNINTAQQNLGIPQVFNIVRTTTATSGDFVEIGKINDPTLQPNGWDMNDVLIKVVASSDAAGGPVSPGYAGIEFNIALTYWLNNGIWQNINQAKTVGLISNPAKSLNLQAFYTNPGDGTGYIKLRLQNPSATISLTWNITIIVYRPFNATFTPTTVTGNDVTAYTNNGMVGENYILNQYYLNSPVVFNNQNTGAPTQFLGLDAGNQATRRSLAQVITDIGVLPVDAISTATDANYTVTTANQLVKLPLITAARTVSLPASASYTGKTIKLWNQNTSATFLWTYASTVKDTTNTTITAIANTTVIMLESDGSNWIKII